MFGIFKKKAKAAKATLSKVENKDLMEAICAGGILVGFAAPKGEVGDFSTEEQAKLQGIIATNPNLKHFGSEIGKTIDAYCDMFEASHRMAKKNLMKEILDVEGDESQKEEAFIIMIDVADADGEIDDAELAVLTEIGKALGLKPEDYI